MATEITIPRMLADIARTERVVTVDADSVGEALEALVTMHPALRVHLFEESGGIRHHVLCFHGDSTVRTDADLAAPLRDGDTITVLQAVSGG